MDSNVGLLRALFAKFNESGEFDFAYVHPDFELHDRPDVPDSRVWHGVDGLRGFFAKIAESFDPIRWEARELTPAGRHVVVQAHITAIGRTSGAPIEAEEAQLWTLQDGLVVRLQGFPSVEDAYATARELDESEGVPPVSPPAG